MFKKQLGEISISDDITEQKYFPSLDGLRGVAIGLILLHHCFGKMFAFFWVGVDLFFALSGFLITKVLLELLKNKNYFLIFFTRRVLRIFPLYYAVLLVALLLSIVFSKSSLNLFSYLIDNQLWFWLYIENWLMFRDGWPPGHNIIFSHFWSLAIEEQYYLIWPFFIYLFSKKKLLWIICILVLLSIFIRSFAGLNNPAYYVATFTRVDGLLMGGLLALLIYDNLRIVNKYSKITFVLSGSVLLLGLCITQNLEYSNHFFVTVGYTFLAFFFTSIIAISIEEKNNQIKKILHNKVLVFMGKYSYGIYVFHFPVFWLLRTSVFTHVSEVVANYQVGKLITSIFCVIVTLLLSLFTYQFIESPFLKLKTKFADK